MSMLGLVESLSRSQSPVAKADVENKVSDYTTLFSLLPPPLRKEGKKIIHAHVDIKTLYRKKGEREGSKMIKEEGSAKK